MTSRLFTRLLFGAALFACVPAPASAQTSPALAATAETASADLSSIQTQYALHARLFDNALDGITDREAARRMSGTTNSFAWIAGHMLWIQHNLAMLTGVATENPYAEQFAFGAQFDPDADYPSLSAMRADWNRLAPLISAALAQMPPEVLASEAPFPLPVDDPSIRGYFAFEQHHLAYEFGQLGLYRRFLGKPALSYP